MDLQQLADRIAIEDLLTRYATAVDTKDWDLFRSCFTDDAQIDYTSAGGVAGPVGEVAEWLESTMAMFAMTQHLVTNVEVTVEGDSARSRAGFFNPMGLQDTSEGAAAGPGHEPLKKFWCGGYYNDELTRTDTGWRIVRRVEETAWSTPFPS